MATNIEIVKMSRLLSRTTSFDIINYIFEDFIELKGDRNFGDDKALIGGIGKLNNKPVTVIGIQKGYNLDENLETNFGQVSPEGYRKALRLMKQAEKFNRPIVCFINTAGAFCGKTAEERGQGEAIARNLFEMAGINVPIISIITGEGGSGGALALAVADRVCIFENAIYSVLSPEGFASILWKDSTRAGEAAELMKLTAKDLLKLKVVDCIFEEHKDGIGSNPEFTLDVVKSYLDEELSVLAIKDKQTLLDERYNRFREFGEYISK